MSLSRVMAVAVLANDLPAISAPASLQHQFYPKVEPLYVAIFANVDVLPPFQLLRCPNDLSCGVERPRLPLYLLLHIRGMPCSGATK